MMVDWSTLPPELLAHSLGMLRSEGSLAAASKSCKAWHTAVAAHRQLIDEALYGEFLWTATDVAGAKYVQNGTLSKDGRCFAFEGVYHPMPTSEGMYACIVAGTVVGVAKDKVRQMESAWLPVGFSAGLAWFVVHKDGENLWTRSGRTP